MPIISRSSTGENLHHESIRQCFSIHRGEAELRSTCDECGNDQNKIAEYLMTLRTIHSFSKLRRQLVQNEKIKYYQQNFNFSNISRIFPRVVGM